MERSVSTNNGETDGFFDDAPCPRTSVSKTKTETEKKHVDKTITKPRIGRQNLGICEKISLWGFWVHVAFILGSFWNHVGVSVGHVGSLWHRVGIMLGSRLNHFGIILGSFWDHLASVSEHL